MDSGWAELPAANSKRRRRLTDARDGRRALHVVHAACESAKQERAMTLR